MHWSVERSLRGVGVGVDMVSVCGCRVFRNALVSSSVSSQAVIGFVCSHEVCLVCAVVKGLVCRWPNIKAIC